MLEACDLSFSFRRNRPLLTDVSFSLAPGTFTAILGRNGCGKSTLLSLLTAARKPQKGRVLLDGVPLASMDRRERARKIAFVAQHSHGNRLTVFDSVLLGRRPFMDAAPTAQDKAIVAQVLEELGLGGYALRYMDELSGGEYQTVVLARAFVQRTGILLLDEPTNNLDPAHQQEVMALVRREVQERGVAAAAVMHDINLALRYCDRFLFLKDGLVDAHGGPEVVTAGQVQRIYGVEVQMLDYNGTKVAIPKG